MPGGLKLGFAMHLVCFVTMARKRLSLSIGIYVLSSIKHCIIKYQVLQIWCVSCESMPWNHTKLPRSDDLGVSDMKGLISWVAQQISTVTRLIHDNHAPDYQKQERKTLSDQTRFALVAPGLYRRASLIDLYLHAKFYWNQRNILWTDRCMHGRTDIWDRLYEVDSEEST